MAAGSGDRERGKEFDDAIIRTHLANERTFLAWLRSALVLLGVGLGAVAFGSEADRAAALAFTVGGVSVVSAVVMVAWAFVTFGTTLAEIEQRRYRPARGLAAAATALIVVIGLVVLTLLAVEALD